MAFFGPPHENEDRQRAGFQHIRTRGSSRLILDIAVALLHLQFLRQSNMPAWDPAAETCGGVVDGGQAIGRVYLDMHPFRPLPTTW